MHTQNHRHAYNVRVSVREIDERDAGCNAQVLRHQLRDCATADSHVQCIVVAALEVLACSKALFDADDPPPTHTSQPLDAMGRREGGTEGGKGEGTEGGTEGGTERGTEEANKKKKMTHSSLVAEVLQDLIETGSTPRAPERVVQRCLLALLRIGQARPWQVLTGVSLSVSLARSLPPSLPLSLSLSLSLSLVLSLSLPCLCE